MKHKKEFVFGTGDKTLVQEVFLGLKHKDEARKESQMTFAVGERESQMSILERMTQNNEL